MEISKYTVSSFSKVGDVLKSNIASLVLLSLQNHFIFIKKVKCGHKVI